MEFNSNGFRKRRKMSMRNFRNLVHRTLQIAIRLRTSSCRKKVLRVAIIKACPSCPKIGYRIIQASM